MIKSLAVQMRRAVEMLGLSSEVGFRSYVSLIFTLETG
jgi:hypothetical protein